MSRKRLKGVVESVKNDKTAVVAVSNLKKHPKYRKFITLTKRFKAHNEGGNLKVGDKVVIEESKPISKDKNWVVLSGGQEVPQKEAQPETGKK